MCKTFNLTKTKWNQDFKKLWLICGSLFRTLFSFQTSVQKIDFNNLRMVSHQKLLTFIKVVLHLKRIQYNHQWLYLHTDKNVQHLDQYLPSSLDWAKELPDSFMASAIRSWTSSMWDWVIWGLSDNTTSGSRVLVWNTIGFKVIHSVCLITYNLNWIISEEMVYECFSVMWLHGEMDVYH